MSVNGSGKTKVDEGAATGGGKRAAGAIAAAAVLACSFLLPGTEMLPAITLHTIGFAAAFLILLIAETLPLSVTCWIILALMPLLHITPDFGTALVGYANPVVFFILASFGIAEAFSAVPLSERILLILLRAFGGSVRRIILALMIASALLSSIVSNVPTCALFVAIGIKFLDMFEDAEDRRRTGKALLIAIPVASMIGGIMTPAGSSINLLAIQLLEDATGQTITFVQWMAIGIPLAVVIVPVAWLLNIKAYKPVELGREAIDRFIGSLDVPRRMGGAEKRVLAVTAAMLTLWILSSWVREINVMVVAMVGCCVFMLPKVGVLTWKRFIGSVNLDAFFLVGTVLSVGRALVDNGVSDLMADLMPQVQMPLPLLVAFATGLTFLLLIIVPVAPSLVTFMAMPMITLAVSMGQSPQLLILVLAMIAGNSYLLPLDTVAVISYSKGYFSMGDMARSTLPLQLFIIAAMSLWLTLMSGALHII
jgi:sodium-dependent dicarboxylate transporter 2/3/5